VNKGRQQLWRFGVLILWMGFISFASTDEFSAANTAGLLEPLIHWFFPHAPEATIAGIHFFVRKAGHFIEYAILAWLAARAFSQASVLWLTRHWFAASIVLIAVYSLADEYHQRFVPSRTSSAYDSMIDTCGGLVMLLAYSWFIKRWQSSLNSTLSGSV